MSSRLLTIAVNNEQGVVAARQRARQIAELLGFEAQDQTRVATALSEIARNAYRYAGGGTVELSLEGERPPQLLIMRIVDCGPGIEDLQRILDGHYESACGMGLGILGSKRLVDQFDLRSRPGEGTEVVLTKILPARAPFVSKARMAELTNTLEVSRPVTTLQELEQQNRELVRALNELRERQEEMARLNRELEDTNRGVVALYAELDERADQLRRADEMKTRFLSNMSHEFRTPLNSIRALSRLLLDRIDGPLTEEQAKQVTLIRKATDDLTGIVDDLLDLDKISAGKIEVRPSEFAMAGLFGMLRGMLRPLLAGDTVALHFDDVSALPPLYTDEAKLSQILRNLISNALKFTERGEVRVSAAAADGGASMRICVVDTGIGIPAQDRERIFEEFTQVAGPLQSRVKGTGLGLPLSRRLAKLLGGNLEVDSTPGVGSTFCLTLPLRYSALVTESVAEAPEPAPDPHQLGLLVVDNDADALREYEAILQGTAFQLLPARTLRQARDVILSARPAAIVLDVDGRDENRWIWLSELKSDPRTRTLPVIVTGSADYPGKARALGAEACAAKPPRRAALLAQLDALVPVRVLVIDDDPTARYTVRRFFGPDVPIVEAEDGIGGLRAAARLHPSLIVLDLQLPDLSGGEVLRQLKASRSTCEIPVAIVTSLDLDEEAAAALTRQGATVLSKSTWNAQAMSALLQRAAPVRRMAEA
jgi:signal transduction histidine kinase/CheY-like chemotaxis protein